MKLLTKCLGIVTGVISALLAVDAKAQPYEEVPPVYVPPENNQPNPGNAYIPTYPEEDPANPVMAYYGPAPVPPNADPDYDEIHELQQIKDNSPTKKYGPLKPRPKPIVDAKRQAQSNQNDDDDIKEYQKIEKIPAKGPIAKYGIRPVPPRKPVPQTREDKDRDNVDLPNPGRKNPIQPIYGMPPVRPVENS